MKTLTTPTESLPFEFGEPRSFAGLTILPLYPQSSSVEYIGLDEAVAHGLEILEVDEHGVVEELHLMNPLDELVLLYEGEELVGAKQNRIVEWTILAEAHSKLTVPVHCVERGRWAYRSQIRRVKEQHPELYVIPRVAAEHVDAMLAVGIDGTVVQFADETRCATSPRTTSKRRVCRIIRGQCVSCLPEL